MATTPATTDSISHGAAEIGEVRNLVEGLLRTVARHGDRNAVRTLDDSIAWTWRELHARAEGLARGLHEIGVRRGDCLALMLSNRPAFHWCDLATILLGAAPFSIYQTSPVDQIEYVLRNSDARVVITERAYLPVIQQAVAAMPHVIRIILADDEGAPISDDETAVGQDWTSLAAVAEAGRRSGVDLDESRGHIGPDTLLTIIYTSGTTGQPKGVEITHGNVLASARDFPSRVHLDHRSRMIGWLPAAHIAERVASYYVPLLFGCSVTSCPDPRKIGAYLAAVRPTYFMGVPRIWEKLRATAESGWTADPNSDVIQRAFDLGIRQVRLEQQGAPLPAELIAELAPLAARYFTPLRRSLGLDALATAHIGSAPAPSELIEFFHVIGVPLAEVWGMSETTAAGISNPSDAIRIGTIGLPTPGVEIRIADDGEILVRSDAVTRGYRGMPAQTAEALVDGWLRTGDIGSRDADGYVRLIGRKKEILISASGKNMYPAVIEAHLKSSTPLIGQACCVGEGRPYNVALLVLDGDYAPVWAAQRGIQDTSLASLAGHPSVLDELENRIQETNAKLSRPEQIKKFFVCPTDWLPGEELTPTMKLRRSAIVDKHAESIESLYEDGASQNGRG